MPELIQWDGMQTLLRLGRSPYWQTKQWLQRLSFASLGNYRLFYRLIRMCILVKTGDGPAATETPTPGY